MTCEMCDRPADNMIAVTASARGAKPRCYWHSSFVMARQAEAKATCKAPGCAREAGAYSGMCSAHVMARVEERRTAA